MTTPTSSNLPAAHRKQVKAANDLIAQLNAKPGEVPPAAAAAPADPNAPTLDLPTVGTVAAPAAAAVQPGEEAAPPPAAPSEVEQANARYKALQGKYNKTEREMAELRGRLEASEQTTRALIEAGQRPAAPAAPAAPMKPEDQFRALGVTEQEIKDYGAELIDIVTRVSRNMTANDLTALRNEIAELKRGMGSVGTVVQQNAQQRVFDALGAAFGDKWVAVNNSDEFLAWLEQVDVFSGSRRLDGLTGAFQKADSARVVAIFRQYMEGNTSSAPTSRQPAVARETLVAPRRRSGECGRNSRIVWWQGVARERDHRLLPACPKREGPHGRLPRDGSGDSPRHRRGSSPG